MTQHNPENKECVLYKVKYHITIPQNQRVECTCPETEQGENHVHAAPYVPTGKDKERFTELLHKAASAPTPKLEGTEISIWNWEDSFNSKFGFGVWKTKARPDGIYSSDVVEFIRNLLSSQRTKDLEAIREAIEKGLLIRFHDNTETDKITRHYNAGMLSALSLVEQIMSKQ